MGSSQYDPNYAPSYNPAFAGNSSMLPPSMPPFGTFNPLFNGMNQAQFHGSVGPFMGGPNFQGTHLGNGPIGGSIIGPGAPLPGAYINPRFAMQFGLMNNAMSSELPAPTQNAQWSGNDATTANPNTEDDSPK
jgi:hypothetical protein